MFVRLNAKIGVGINERSRCMIITIASFKGGVGKSTTALHLAEYFNRLAPTLLVDGDANRSALDWASRGNLAFKVCDEAQGVKFARKYEHILIDTPARPNEEDLQALAEGCDLLVIPTSPDALAMGAMMKTIGVLHELEANYKILVTLIPPAPSRVGTEAIAALKRAKLPVFKTGIRRLAAFQKAALQGCTVGELKGDKLARVAWRCYEQVGQEILK